MGIVRFVRQVPASLSMIFRSGPSRSGRFQQVRGNHAATKSERMSSRGTGTAPAVGAARG